MPKKDDKDLREQLEETRAALLRAEIRVEFRDLVAESIEDIAESLADVATEIAILREKVAQNEKEIYSLSERVQKQESSFLNQISSLLTGWLQKGSS